MSEYLPPPTVNSLGPKQRARLLQSSRKLGAILGTTPQFIEVDEASPARPHSFRRDGRLFQHSPSSSVTSYASSQSLLPLPPPPPPPKSSLSVKLVVGSYSTKGPKTPKTAKHPAPSPLVLHYKALGSGYDPRASIISTLGSECDMPTAVPRSPLSPRHQASSTVDYRRKRMAKLARTLGENVPPELVFPTLASEKANNDRRQLRASRGRSWSVGSQAPAPVVHRKPSIVKHSFDTFEGRSRKDSLAFHGFAERSVSRADSIDTSSFVDMSRSSSPFSQHSVDVDGVTTRRKQREWSGEWNSHDMDNVIKSLRDLKAK